MTRLPLARRHDEVPAALALRPAPRASLVFGWAHLLAVLFAVSMASEAPAADSFRVATFNVALYGPRSGAVLARLARRDDPQAQHLAEIIQRVRPEVLVFNEIDYDPEGRTVDAFCDNYLAVAQHASGAADGPSRPIAYPHRYSAPTNTGVHSGVDLDGNGRVDAAPGQPDYAGDCWGYGVYPGQYALAVVSQHPIDRDAIRTFQKFLWRDMPAARLPDRAETPEPDDWYDAARLATFRLSSKNHCDVPIDVGGRTLHVLAAHPTPPVYDGAEDRNGRRNHDEVRLWADYVGGGDAAAYLVDDAGVRGGLAVGADAAEPPSFVIAGDLNSDPHDGEGSASIAQLLGSPRLCPAPFPRSVGAVAAATAQGGANQRHAGDPAEDTCDPADDPGPGNLHLDYVLPSRDLRVVASGVYWPAPSEPTSRLTAGAQHPASSDHRLVWVDLAW